MRRVIPRGPLHIGWADLFAAMGACLHTRKAPQSEADIMALWPAHTVVTASVRSAFDAMLACLHLPRGSEVLVSCINVPDMFALLRQHGLVPVPVDVDPQTLLPNLEALERACTPRTRAMLLAHLLGAYTPLGAYAQLARRRNLLLWEDCAQAFTGNFAMGHADSDAVFFSFGPIKTSTALGCAVTRFRDPALANSVRARVAGYGRQPTHQFLRRVGKYMAMKWLGTHPGAFAGVAQAAKLLGQDYDAWITAWTQSRAATHLNQRPCAAQLALLLRRLQNFDPSHIETRQRLGAELRSVAEILGAQQANATYWQVPVLSHNAAGLLAYLQAHGFDATTGSSKMQPCQSPEHPVPVATDLMRRVVYVPLYPQLPAHDVRRLHVCVRAFETASAARSHRER